MNRRLALLFAVALPAVALPAVANRAAAEVRTREVEYRQGGTALKGYVAWDDAAKGRRPGVLVVHEWWGHNRHARNQAERLAKSGYVGFALDMYGEGRVAAHPEEAQAFVAEATKDPAVLAARFDAALAELKQDPHVDPDRIAAIGYCFGGAVALGMARSGADLDAVATFHAALATGQPVEKGKVRARILVMTGADDPLVPAEQVAAFESEMKAASASCEVIRYPGVKHSFTNPEAGTHGMEALVYDAGADRKSWAAMLKMFRKALK
jgi:dienelactone hydrolase